MTRHNALPEPFINTPRTAYAAGSFQLDVQVAYMDMLANTLCARREKRLAALP